MRVAVILCLTAVACQGSQSVEIPPPVDASLIAMSGGLLHTCAVTTTNHVYCWCWNRDGEIGDGSTTDRPYATRIGNTLRLGLPATGAAHSCAVGAGGDAYCWGLNLTGQIGDSSVVSRTMPTAVKGTLSFGRVAGGGTFTCGISATDSSAYCWGWGRDGELGSRPIQTCPTSGGPEPCTRAPSAVGGGLRFLAITTGARHACALAVDSTAYCWGDNSAGQLGNGTVADTALPLAVSGGLKFKLLTSGFSHTCGLTAGGDAYCWGDNTWEHLGETVTRQALQPTAITGGIILLALGAGGAPGFPDSRVSVLDIHADRECHARTRCGGRCDDGAAGCARRRNHGTPRDQRPRARGVRGCGLARDRGHALHIRRGDRISEHRRLGDDSAHATTRAQTKKSLWLEDRDRTWREWRRRRGDPRWRRAPLRVRQRRRSA